MPFLTAASCPKRDFYTTPRHNGQFFMKKCNNYFLTNYKVLTIQIQFTKLFHNISASRTKIVLFLNIFILKWKYGFQI